MASTDAPPRLVLLARQLADAKKRESAAKKDREVVERAIIALTGFDKPEGQETFEASTPGGSICKIVLKQPISTKFDGTRWPVVRADLSGKARKCVKQKWELDSKLARELQESEPGSWAAISVLVTRKPGKIGVDLKVVDIEDGDKLESLSGKSPKAEKAGS